MGRLGGEGFEEAGGDEVGCRAQRWVVPGPYRASSFIRNRPN